VVGNCLQYSNVLPHAWLLTAVFYYVIMLLRAWSLFAVQYYIMLPRAPQGEQ